MSDKLNNQDKSAAEIMLEWVQEQGDEYRLMRADVYLRHLKEPGNKQYIDLINLMKAAERELNTYDAAFWETKPDEDALLNFIKEKFVKFYNENHRSSKS